MSPPLRRKPPRSGRTPPKGTKRVELHLHTRYSTLDALTDPTAAVKTAARWGHRAIAVTDHGVAQAFPEFWHAGAKCGIKVIYGVEGYYINDVDDFSPSTGRAISHSIPILSALISKRPAWTATFTASPRSARCAWKMAS